MGNVHVTTRMIQLAVLVEIPISLRHWSRYCTYRLFQLQLFWYLSTRMGPNPLFLFSMLQWVVTYMWLLVDEFNSQYWWNYPTSLTHWSIRTGSSSSNYFGIFQPGWALTLLFLFSTLQWVTYMWLLVDEFNSAVLWNYPHFFETLEPLLYIQVLAPTIFCIPNRDGPNFVLFSMPNGL
jgi:hypothetical protein